MTVESESIKQEEKTRSGILLLVILVLMVLAIWIAVPFLIAGEFSNWGERGQFGDLFGSVNALFSGLAFAGLFYTIYLQRQELALQRQELKLQRNEMKGSRGHLAAQALAQEKMFLATFKQIEIAEIQAKIEATKILCGPDSNQITRDKASTIIDGLAGQIALITNGIHIEIERLEILRDLDKAQSKYLDV